MGVLLDMNDKMIFWFCNGNYVIESVIPEHLWDGVVPAACVENGLVQLYEGAEVPWDSICANLPPKYSTFRLWSFNNHLQFSEEFRSLVFLLLLIMRRYSERHVAYRLPKPIFAMIVNFI